MTSSKAIGPFSTQVSLLLFTDRYYSMNRISGTEPSEFYKERFQPSDSEKLDRYNRFLVNAGMSVEDSTLEMDWKAILSAESVSDPYTAQGYHFKYEFALIPD